MCRQQRDRHDKQPAEVSPKDTWLPPGAGRGIVFPAEDVLGAHLTDRKTGRVTTIDLTGDSDLVVFVGDELYVESRLRPRDAGASTPADCLTGDHVRETLTVAKYQTHSLVRAEQGCIWHLWVNEVLHRPAGAVDLFRLVVVELSRAGEVRLVQRISFFTVEKAVQFASKAPLPFQLPGSPSSQQGEEG